MAAREKFEWMLAGGLVACAGFLLVGHDRSLSDDDDAPGRAPPAGPGQGASSPSEIPVRGWKEIVKRVAAAFSQDRILANAAGVTFYAILALFPALGALVSLYGLFSTPSGMEAQIKALSDLVPAGGMQVISDQLHSLASGGSASLSFGLVVGLATALWSSNSGVKGLFDALNAAYEVPEGRGFLKLTLISFAFTLGGLAFILLAMAAVIVLPAVLNFVGVGNTLDAVLRLARWPVLLLLIGFVLAVIYRYGPSRKAPKWRWVTWGSAFASIAWVLLSVLFSWYVTNFANYNKTYGSLGAAIGFMTWIWLSMAIVLIGGEFNRETEAQAAHEVQPQTS
jgi:membrane protein